MRRRPLIAALLVGLLALVGTGCDYLQARDHLNKGVAAMKSAKYKEATEHFKQSIALDPDWDVPQLYLAMANMTQWIPGAQSVENQEFGDQAREGFKKVLEHNPKDTTALASLASMALSEATSGAKTFDERNTLLDEAIKWNQARVAAEPSAEAYYSLGVIAFDKWEPVWSETRTNLKMRRDEPGPLNDKKTRETLKETHGALLDDSLTNLQKSLELDPEYENAMTYMSIVTRMKADLLDDKASYEAAIAEADQWVDKGLQVRKIKAERAAKKANSGIVQE